MTAPRWRDDTFALLRRGLAPPMPDAACVGQAAMFDAPTPADVKQAQRICLTACPELTPCRQWAATSTGLLGVIAGHHHTPHTKDDDDHQ